MISTRSSDEDKSLTQTPQDPRSVVCALAAEAGEPEVLRLDEANPRPDSPGRPSQRRPSPPAGDTVAAVGAERKVEGVHNKCVSQPREIIVHYMMHDCTVMYTML